MFKGIDVYLKKRTSDVVFIELKENKSFSFNSAKIDYKTPLPIPVKDIVTQVKGAQVSDFKLSSIIEGMVTILGIDMEFLYKDAYLEFLLSLDEDIVTKVLSKGMHLAENGNRVEALIHFRAAYLLKGEDLNIIYSYGRCLEELALESENDEQLQRMFLDEAFETFSYLRDAYPDSPFSYYHLGFHLVNQKSYKAAESVWKKALMMELDDEKKSEIISRLNDINAKIDYEEGYNLVLDGMYHEGLQKLLPLEDEYNDWWNLLFFIGLAYRQLGDFDDALKYYQKVLSLNTGHIDTFNEVALCYMSLGQYESAKKYIQEALKMAPMNNELLCNLGIALLNLEDIDGAKDAIKKSLEVDPDDEVTKAWNEHINNNF